LPLPLSAMAYSPLLAIVTGVLEFAAAGWIFLSPGRGRKRILYPMGLIFLMLAAYQFSEVAVCSRPDVTSFTRLAFFNVTWLPPLGLWLGSQFNSPKTRWLRTAALVDFALALGMSIWIFTSARAITGSVCQTVIARYLDASPFDVVYGIFYQGSLGVLIFAAAAGMASAEDPVLRKHWANLQVGILGFILPALAVRVLVNEQPGLLPSVMCHFALILAVSLFFAAVRERKAGAV
jgi:hypothetical protein